jgi:hypothetical protein
MLNPGKDLTQPSSYRPISFLDTVGKLFDKILLSRVLREVNERGVLRNEQSGFRPKHSTTVHCPAMLKEPKQTLTTGG